MSDPVPEAEPGVVAAVSVRGEHADAPDLTAARTRLAELDDAPLEQHVDVYEDVHQRLQEGLADLDER